MTAKEIFREKKSPQKIFFSKEQKTEKLKCIKRIKSHFLPVLYPGHRPRPRQGLIFSP